MIKMRAIAVMTAVSLVGCQAVRPQDVVMQEQAACYQQGPGSQSCTDYAQDKAAMDENAHTTAVLAPLLIGVAVLGAIAGVAATDHHPPPPHQGAPPPHPGP